MPKSVRYVCSGPPRRASTRMLPGLTSRCTRPAACAASSADATGEMKAAARRGGSAPSRITPCRLPPATNRIAMNCTPSASPASYTGMMCGWSTAATARASRTNRLRTASSPASTFSATTRPRRSSRAWYTAAIPPTPTSRSSRYPATREPGVSPLSGPPSRGGDSPATIPPPGQPSRSSQSDSKPTPVAASQTWAAGGRSADRVKPRLMMAPSDDLRPPRRDGRPRRRRPRSRPGSRRR